jgi:hypothetical protein
MATPPVQPDYAQVFQEFHSWVQRKYSHEVIINPNTTDSVLLEFVAPSDLKQYFEEDGHRRLTNIITALFPHNENIYSDDIFPEKLAVFCTLMNISKGRWIEHFCQYDTLRDISLPFSPNNRPLDWPETPDDQEFLQKFCQEQWKFCVPVMKRPFVDKRFQKDQVLPIIFKKALNTGGSAALWLIKLHPAHNELITDDEKKVRRTSFTTTSLRPAGKHWLTSTRN